MVYKVLVVDDSQFFQQRLKDIIDSHPELRVIGLASNGQEAIEMDEKLQPDVISMDYEMPLLDGVSAVREIRSRRPVPIIMFSSLTYEGARITLDALEAGASDFISKDFAEISQKSQRLKTQLHSTLLSLARGAAQEAKVSPPEPSAPEPANESAPKALVSAPSRASQSVVSSRNVAPQPKAIPARQPAVATSNVSRPAQAKVLIIGASTGGPVAVNEVLKCLPGNFPLPIIIIQHMPPNFTRALAERLNKTCNVNVKEALHGDRLQPGQALIAPGGYQLMFDGGVNGATVKIVEGDDRMPYKPSLDITFASGANHFGAALMGVVLTGMGADGCEGAKILKQSGGVLWSQDQASCVVYGMPKAVADAGLSEHVLSINEIGPALAKGG